MNYPFGFSQSLSDPTIIYPYELDEKRVGNCICGNKLEFQVHFYHQIKDGKTYCIACNKFTLIKNLEVQK